MGTSPTSRTVRELDDWQIGLVYEAAMSFPLEGMRESFNKRRSSAANFDDADLLEAGYSPEEFSAIRGE